MLCKTVIGLALAVLAPGAQAQEATVDPPRALEQFVELMDGMCPQLVLGLVTRPDLADTFKERPTDVEAVCGCAKKAVLADGRLGVQFRARQGVILEKLKSTGLKSYATVRVVKSALVCMAEDIEKSLAAAKLEP